MIAAVAYQWAVLLLPRSHRHQAASDSPRICWSVAQGASSPLLCGEPLRSSTVSSSWHAVTMAILSGVADLHSPHGPPSSSSGPSWAQSQRQCSWVSSAQDPIGHLSSRSLEPFQPSSIGHPCFKQTSCSCPSGTGHASSYWIAPHTSADQVLTDPVLYY